MPALGGCRASAGRSCGEVRRAETLHWRTLAPVPEGLFCETIFGLVTDDRERRRRFGHLELAAPVVHPWLLPSIALLLDREPGRLLATSGTHWRQSGVYALRQELEELDLAALADAPAGPRRDLARALQASGTAPAQLVWDVLPVFPPALRPIIPLGGGRFASSDLNDLYRRVISRNWRLASLVQLHAPDALLRNEHQVLQREVHALLSSRRGGVVVEEDGRVLRCLSTLVCGERGRLRTNTQTRVDYSAIGVVVPTTAAGPNEILLPLAIAAELLKPTVYGCLEDHGVTTLKEAKHRLQTALADQREAIEEAAASHLLLLFTVAPTPLRLRGFLPRVWDGPAIGLNPDVAQALGLRFAGERVRLHLPLGEEARSEVEGLLAPKPRGLPRLVGSTPGRGWLTRALAEPTPETLIDAALRGEEDPLVDPWSRALVGRRALRQP